MVDWSLVGGGAGTPVADRVYRVQNPPNYVRTPPRPQHKRLTGAYVTEPASRRGALARYAPRSASESSTVRRFATGRSSGNPSNAARGASPTSSARLGLAWRAIAATTSARGTRRWSSTLVDTCATPRAS